MNNRFFSFFFAAVLALLTACKNDDDNHKDQLVEIYQGATIYTMNDSLPQATSIAIQGGKIIRVGSDDDMKGIDSDNVVVIDLQGKTILPGLIETHIHPIFATIFNAANAFFVDSDCNKEQIINQIRIFYEANPDAQQIFCAGFSVANVLDTNKKLPTKYDLDQISTTIPIFIYDEGLHASWCNSKALEMANIDQTTPDPPESGHFFRFPNSNEPTGFNEETASFFILSKLPFFTEDNLYSACEQFLSYLSSLGFTALFDASETPVDEIAKLFERLATSGNLNQYYQRSIRIASSLSGDENVESVRLFADRCSSENLFVNVGKIWLDGTFETNNAATFEPLLNADTIVEPFFSQEQLTNNIRALLTAGYNVHIHVIGDKAQDYALNSFLATDNINPHLTRTLAHNELFAQGACAKIAQLKCNFFITSTPSWTVDEERDFSEEILGTDRMNRMYLWRSAMEAGAKMCIGSDYPASTLYEINPFYQIYCAQKRLDTSSGFLQPATEGLTRAEAFKAYTSTAAEQLSISDRTGSLVAGKNADFIVVNQDVMTCNLDQLPNTIVEKVFFQGKEIVAISNQ